MVTCECSRCGAEFDTVPKLKRHQTSKTTCPDKYAKALEEIAKLKAELALKSTPNALVPLKFVDLFCGIGGFHQALISFGAQCVLACDIDAKCREVYKDNYGLEPKEDVTKLVSAEMPDFDILCGGFPCQAFSHAGKQDGFEDTRGTLFRDICRILREKRPKYFLLENVKNLKGHNKGDTWKTIYKCLTESGYTTYETPIVLSPHQLGIPQHRERVMIMGWRNDVLPASGLPIIPKVSPPADVNIQSVLMDDVDIPEGTALTTTDIEVLTLWETFIQHFKKKGIKLPTFPMWSNDWDSKYDVTEEVKTESEEEEEEDEEDEEDEEGEESKEKVKNYKYPAWKQKFVLQNRAFYTEHKKFLEPWLKKARACAAFAGAKRKLEWQAGKFQTDDSIWKLLFQFRPSGIRVKRANYSPALVAMAQIVYVGQKKRKLCPREVARLQSFPDSFKLPASAGIAYKQFGNSVNVEVIKYAAKILLGNTNPPS
jgi:DNA (cytosine-5)-methyltransferase 1